MCKCVFLGMVVALTIVPIVVCYATTAGVHTPKYCTEVEESVAFDTILLQTEYKHVSMHSAGISSRKLAANRIARVDTNASSANVSSSLSHLEGKLVTEKHRKKERKKERKEERGETSYSGPRGKVQRLALLGRRGLTSTEVLQHMNLEAGNNRILILIVSCHKHADRWSVLHQWGRHVHPGGDVLILAGTQPGSDPFDVPYRLSLETGILLVNATDAYEALPEKMLRAYHAIHSATEFLNITHVLKIDDTNVLDSDPALYQLDANLMEKALERQTADYMAPPLGYNIIHCTDSPFVSWWHVSHGDEMSNTSYWKDRPYVVQGPSFAFAAGGSGYILSRRALGTLTERWPLASMAELARTHVAEDLAVGLTLFEEGIKAVPVELDGFASNACADLDLNGKFDSLCVTEKEMLAARTCCWYCADDANHPLCRDIVVMHVWP